MLGAYPVLSTLGKVGRGLASPDLGKATESREHLSYFQIIPDPEISEKLSKVLANFHAALKHMV